jgi:hypothetical protein
VRWPRGLYRLEQFAQVRAEVGRNGSQSDETRALSVEIVIGIAALRVLAVVLRSAGECSRDCTC